VIWAPPAGFGTEPWPPIGFPLFSALSIASPDTIILLMVDYHAAVGGRAIRPQCPPPQLAFVSVRHTPSYQPYYPVDVLCTSPSDQSRQQAMNPSRPVDPSTHWATHDKTRDSPCQRQQNAHNSVACSSQYYVAYIRVAQRICGSQPLAADNFFKTVRLLITSFFSLSDVTLPTFSTTFLIYVQECALSFSITRIHYVPPYHL